jgi:ubiquitin carboxyl-terminal hydrolase 4/11/15
LLPKANTELQRRLTFTTSSTKKRKLSPQHTKRQDSDNNPDIPLNSVEDHESQLPSDLPRFDIPAKEDGRSDSAFPPHIPSHLQSSSSLSTFDYISSAASSPSAAYAGLSIDSEKAGDLSGSELWKSSLASNEQDTRGQSPIRLFGHRSIMGGAADLPQRSSSPLKRRASDLEGEVPSSWKDDVDMIAVPTSDPPDTMNTSTQSVDMLKEEHEAEAEADPPQAAVDGKSAETGT